jgi:phosphoribosylanthranilate isomerase
MTRRPLRYGRTRIKVCCIASRAEAELAITQGADAIGLVSAMPSGPGVIPDDRIQEIAAIIPPGVSTFLLTSSCEVEEIVSQQRRLGVDTLQLCDELPPESIRDLRSRLPGISIVQVVHVIGEASLEQARAAAAAAHGLLLDSGNPSKAIKELGGTGRTHDWELSRRIRDTVDVPVFLAGGLTPENVADAVRRVRPFGVDVCSGLRTDGALDTVKLARFVRELEVVDRTPDH